MDSYKVGEISWTPRQQRESQNGGVSPSPKQHQAWATAEGKQRADGGSPPHLGGQAAALLANAASKLWQLGLGQGVEVVGGLGRAVGGRRQYSWLGRLSLTPFCLSQTLLVGWGGCTELGCSAPLGLKAGVAKFPQKQI